MPVVEPAPPPAVAVCMELGLAGENIPATDDPASEERKWMARIRPMGRRRRPRGLSRSAREESRAWH